MYTNPNLLYINLIYLSSLILLGTTVTKYAHKKAKS